MALLAVFVFSLFPLTIRYGRAFQPDASMLGATVAGLACWDRSLAASVASRWLVAGWCLLALGFAIKITSAFLLIPLLFLIARSGRRRQMIAACATLLPGMFWYLWADHLIGQGVGSRASADNRSIWLAVLGPSALFDATTLKVVGWSLLVRAFTPLGAVLALVGLCEANAANHAAIDRSGGSGAVPRWRRWRFWPESCTTSITGSRWHRWRPWVWPASLELLAGPSAACSSELLRAFSWPYPSSRPAPPGGLRPSGRTSSGRQSGAGGRAAGCLGGGFRGALVPGRPPRMPHGVDGRCGGKGGR